MLAEPALEVKEKANFLAPLFERLDCQAPDFLTEDQVKQSIQNEISLMMNTRCKIGEIPESTEEINPYLIPEIFGIMDFSALRGEDPAQWPQLATYLERCICSFEPRFKNPRVQISRLDNLKQELQLALSGTVVLGKKTEQITFPLAFPLQLPSHS